MKFSVSCRLPLFYRIMGVGPITDDRKRQIAFLRENDADLDSKLLDWVSLSG